MIAEHTGGTQLHVHTGSNWRVDSDTYNWFYRNINFIHEGHRHAMTFALIGVIQILLCFLCEVHLPIFSCNLIGKILSTFVYCTGLTQVHTGSYWCVNSDTPTVY